MAREKIGERTSLILDEQTRQEIEAAMESTGENSAAALLRKAIVKGLPLVKSGGEAVSLDGELSADVDQVAGWHKWTRQRVLIEAIRAGLQAVHARWALEHPEGDKISAPEAANLFAYWPDSQPLARDLQAARREALRLRQLLGEVEATADGARALETLRARQTLAADAAPKSPKRKAIQ